MTVSVVRTQRQTIARVFPHQGNRRVLIHSKSKLPAPAPSGIELVQNWTFETDIASWDYSGAGTFAWAGAEKAARHESVGAGGVDTVQLFQLGLRTVNGVSYRTRAVWSCTGGVQARLAVFANSVQLATSALYGGSTPKTSEFTFTANAFLPTIALVCSPTGGGQVSLLYAASCIKV